MSKVIILIRHAHRDTTNRKLDNGLSDKGYKQAEIIKQWLPQQIKTLKLKSIFAVTSPKKRCVETITPVARRTLATLEVWDELDEQGFAESQEKFWERVQATIHNIHQRPEELVMVCSHGDYLPLFIFHLIGVNLELSKGGICALSVEGKLLFYIPSLKEFKP